jgi:hypothetical protein
VNYRIALSLANLAAIVAAFVVLFEFPQYSAYAFYALVAWIFVGFALLYLPRRAARPGPSPGGGAAGPFGGPAGAPLPSSTPGSAPAPVDFCIYCGTTLPSGATTCPSCGHGRATI